MSPERSNITPASNIYVLKGDFTTDRKFQSMVRGRRSLRSMLKVLAGLAWVKGEVSVDAYTHLLTELQRDEWELGMYCALGDPEEIVWGVVKKGAEYRVACRCYRTDCPHFSECRPDYAPGEGPQVQPPGEEAALPEPAEGPIWEIVRPERLSDAAGASDAVDGTAVIDIEIDEEKAAGPLVRPAPVGPDEAQDAVITGGADELMLVVAGPGAGKTHSLLRKLEYMVDKKRMVEAGAVLLLCFTRAAVAEIRERFWGGVRSGRYSDDLARMDIRTFDSFATEVLIKWLGIDCSGMDYNERIERLVAKIESAPGIIGESGMRHFMVDEIQDLVGVRARLVWAIIDNRPPGCGVTLLGDPLQAIYGFEAEDEPYTPDSMSFPQRILEDCPGRFRVVNLTGNRRQTANLAVFSARARSLLERGDPAGTRQFLGEVKGLPSAGDCANFVPRVEPGEKGAVLCRNNGEVLKVSGYLRQREIAHNVRRRRTRWLLPAWMAELLDGRRTALTLDDLSAANPGVPDPDRIFAQLQYLAEGTGGAVDLRSVRRALAGGRKLPDDLYEEPFQPLVVSTIHQAKGREYDVVYLLEPNVAEDADNLAEEGRVYYVAVTRARNRLYKLERSRSPGYLKKTAFGKRWYQRGWRPNGRPYLIGVEAGMEHDIDEESFVEVLEPEADPVETQRYIRDEVKPGDPLRLVRIDGERKLYGILHRNRLIGRMSDRFTIGVRETMNEVYPGSRYLPPRFSGVYAERVYTIVRRPETIGAHLVGPYADTGVWYGVNVTGMGMIRD